MRLPEARAEEWAEYRPAILSVARESIRHGVETGHPLDVEESEYPAALRQRRATFVTLRKRGELRGCTGVIEPRRPLIRDVAVNAFRSAFHDPRFPPVEAGEIPDLDIHVSILSPTERLPCSSEAELITRLRPGRDGLLLHEGARSATFLPAVWRQLPEPRAFVRELKRKAGLPLDYWSPTIWFERYTAEEVG